MENKKNDASDYSYILPPNVVAADESNGETGASLGYRNYCCGSRLISTVGASFL